MTVYNLPQNYEKLSSAFKVMCGDKQIGVYDCDVSAYPLNQVWPGYQRPFEQTEPTSYLSVGCNSALLLDITPQKEFKKVTVRPLSRNITPEIMGDTVRIKFPGPGQYSVEFDDTHHVLTVFINPQKTFDVSEDDPNVIYFGAGVHYMEKIIELSDNQTVYIDKNAVVYGGIKAVGKKNVSILGYGVLDNSYVNRGEGTTIGFQRCENVYVEGVVVVNSCGWSMHYSGCVNVTVDNIKLIGMWRYNSDGCDFTNCTNAVIRNSYLRNYDDCIVIKGLNGGNRMLPVSNNYAENCVLWCDWGRALELGAETCAPTFSGIKFKNCDIIHGDAVMMDLQHGDMANFSNIYFEDIRVEYSAKAQAPVMQSAPGEVYVNKNEKHMPMLFVISTIHTMWSTDDKTGNIENVYFKNITVTTEDGRIPSSYVSADAKDTTVSGIHFENVVVNGKRMTSLEELNFRIGSVGEITIK